MRKLLSNLEMSSFSYFIMRCAFIGISMNNLILITQQDSCISILLGFVIGFIPLFLFLSIMDYRRDYNFSELINHLFGKTLGKCINIILSLFLILLSIIIFWDLTNLITSQYLSKTPAFVVGIVFFIPTVYLLLKGIAVIGKSSTILFFISLILFLIPFFGLFFQVKFSHLFPILNQGVTPILKGTHQYIANNILPLFLILAIPKDMIKDQKKFNKNMILSYTLINLTLFCILFFTLTVFGVELANLYQYPEFHLLKRVSIGGFVQRIESTLSIQWIFDLFMTNLLTLYFLHTTLETTFHITKTKKKNIIIFIVSLICLIASNYIFSNNTIGTEFLKNTFPSLLTIFFFLLPLAIILRIKMDKQKIEQDT